VSNGAPGQSQTYGNAASANEILRAGGMQGQFGGALGMNDGFVYMGPDYKAPPLKSARLPKRQPKPPSPAEMGLMSPQQAEMTFWRFDPQQKQQWAELSRQYLGYRRPPAESTQFGLWRQMIGYAGQASSAWGQNVSPFEMMANAASRATPKQGTGGGGGYRGPVTTYDTTEQVNLSNPSEARAFLDQSLGGLLGRAPTPKEYRTFRNALNAAEEASPELIESVTKTTPGQATQRQESKVRREGGIAPGQFATEWSRSQEGVAETQAGTTLLNAFLEMF